jgi:uncharacterized protein
MNPEKDLNKLIISLSPELTEGEYVFCAFENSHYGDHLNLEPIAAISEKEGLTLIVPKLKAKAENIPFEAVYKQITLNVHSSLEAVGLTAALSKKLTENGISMNVVAGFYHDHIFVQSEQAENAINALNELSHEAGETSFKKKS